MKIVRAILTAALSLALASTFAAAAGPGALVPKPLVPKPLPPNDVLPNPWLSSGDCVIHNDPYSSDVTGAVLPLGINPILTSADDPLNPVSPSSALYDEDGNAIVQLRGGLSIADLDSPVIARSGRFSPYMGDDGDQKYSLQTSYSMVDAKGRAIAPTSHGHIVFLEMRDEDGEIREIFKKILDVDVVSAMEKALDGKVDPRLLSLIYDYDGNLWFVSGGFLVDPVRDAEKYGAGFLGYLEGDYIERALAGELGGEDAEDYIHFYKLEPGEGAENGISSCEHGAVILTNRRCFLLNASIDGVKVEWETPYRSDGYKAALGGLYQGSGLAWGGGSTPTLTRDLVLFTDNQEIPHLIALDVRTGEKVADTPVLEMENDLPVSVENSILVYSSSPERASVVICNWYGAGNAGLSLPDADSSIQTWENIYDAQWMAEGNRHIAPGVTRVDVVRQPDGLYATETKWLRDDIRETAMMKLSTATGYLYGYWQVTEDLETWRYEILDFDTGATVYSYPVSKDPRYNNMAVGMIPSPKGNGLYVPTNLETRTLLCLRDAFASLPEDCGASMPLSALSRSCMDAETFQSLSGTALTPASYLMGAELSGLTEDTILTFQVNGLNSAPSRYVLYRQEADGTLAPVPSDQWALAAEGDDPLQPEQLYTLTLELKAGTARVSVILAERNDGTAPHSRFLDVAYGTFYFDAVEWAAANGITTGKANGVFDPEGSCTRAEMVTFLWRAAGSPEPGSTENPFADVPTGAYYAGAVAWAVEKGITQGVSPDRFGPDVTVTRDQAVTFLYRYKGSPSVDGGSSFSDVASGAYYADAVAWEVKAGVTNGTGAAAFSPAKNCTRGEIVTFLYRIR